MECPACGRSKNVEIDTHSDGFAQNLQECGACGALWIRKGDQEILIHQAAPRVVNA